MKSKLFVLGAATLLLASCSNVLDVPVDQAVVGWGATPLSINVLANPTTKSQITGDKLPNGSKIGVTLIATDASDGQYDSHEYKNIYYSTTDGATWAIDNTKSILLSATDGTVYAYYPYDVNVTNIENITINATDGTDYMYAEPVSGIKNSNAAAQLTMKHALSVVKFTIQGASTNAYTGAGVISNVKLEGATMGNTGSMNIKTQTVSASAGAMTYTSQLKLNPANESETNHAQVFAVPTGTQSAIKFTVTMDGQDYTATTGDVTLASGQQYSYTLKMSSTGLTVNTVTVTEWGAPEDIGSGNAQLYKPILTWDEAKTKDGVYGMTSDGKAMIYEAAAASDESLSGVAFVLKGKAYQVAKTNATGYGGTTYDVYWWMNNRQDIPDLTSYTTADGTNSYAYLPKADGSWGGSTHLDGDWTKWSAYVNASLSDFNGQANTDLIIAAQTIEGVVQDYTLAKAVVDFRGNSTANEGQTDWYAPACGQLAFMFLKQNELNELLSKVSGTQSLSGDYWSSSEYSFSNAWSVGFSNGDVDYSYKNRNRVRLRLIRAI